MKKPCLQSRLPASFYDRDPSQVARELLGMWLMRKFGVTGLWLHWQTEAYLASGDPASHMRKKHQILPCSVRLAHCTSIQSCQPLHECCNTDIGNRQPVLIRAIEPFCGLPTMQANRGTSHPGKLTTVQNAVRRDVIDHLTEEPHSFFPRRYFFQWSNRYPSLSNWPYRRHEAKTLC